MAHSDTEVFLWTAKGTICPTCSEVTVEVEKAIAKDGRTGWYAGEVRECLRAYPTNIFRRLTPPEIPAAIKEDYEEAARVLPISQKASAALSRRCLQVVLSGQGYQQRDLAQQIDALLNQPDPTRAIPTSLRQTVDAIRNFGNFSAHPITDKTTLQVIAVEPGEAEWCLDILEEMFDHFYVKPAEAARRKAALDAKLLAAGKPPSKA